MLGDSIQGLFFDIIFMQKMLMDFIWILWILWDVCLPSGKRLQNYMENHHAINGTTHYFDWAIFNSKLLVYQRVNHLFAQQSINSQQISTIVDPPMAPRHISAPQQHRRRRCHPGPKAAALRRRRRRGDRTPPWWQRRVRNQRKVLDDMNYYVIYIYIYIYIHINQSINQSVSQSINLSIYLSICYEYL